MQPSFGFMEELRGVTLGEFFQEEEGGGEGKKGEGKNGEGKKDSSEESNQKDSSSEESSQTLDLSTKTLPDLLAAFYHSVCFHSHPGAGSLVSVAALFSPPGR